MSNTKAFTSPTGIGLNLKKLVAPVATTIQSSQSTRNQPELLDDTHWEEMSEEISESEASESESNGSISHHTTVTSTNNSQYPITTIITPHKRISRKKGEKSRSKTQNKLDSIANSKKRFELDQLNHKLALHHLIEPQDGYVVDSTIFGNIIKEEKESKVLLRYNTMLFSEVDTLLQGKTSLGTGIRPRQDDPIYTIWNTNYSEEKIWLKRGNLVDLENQSSENLLDCLIAFFYGYSKSLLISPEEMIKIKKQTKIDCVTNIIQTCFGELLSNKESEVFLLTGIQSCYNIVYATGEERKETQNINTVQLFLNHLCDKFNECHGFKNLEECKPCLLSEINLPPPLNSGLTYKNKLARILSTLWFYSPQRIIIRDNSVYGSKRFVFEFINKLIQCKKLGNPLDDSLLIRLWSEIQNSSVLIYGFSKVKQQQIGVVKKLVEISEIVPLDQNPSGGSLKTFNDKGSETKDKCFVYLFQHHGKYDLLTYTMIKNHQLVRTPSTFSNVSKMDIRKSRLSLEILNAVEQTRVVLKQQKQYNQQSTHHSSEIKSSCSYCKNHFWWHACNKNLNDVGCKVTISQKPISPSSILISSPKVSISPNLTVVENNSANETVKENVEISLSTSLSPPKLDPSHWIDIEDVRLNDLIKMYTCQKNKSLKKLNEQVESELLNSPSIIQERKIINLDSKQATYKSNSALEIQNKKASLELTIRGKSSADPSKEGPVYKSWVNALSWIRTSMTFIKTREEKEENDVKNSCEFHSVHFLKVYRNEPLNLYVHDLTGSSFDLGQSRDITNVHMIANFFKFLKAQSIKQEDYQSNQSARSQMLANLVNSVWNNTYFLKSVEAARNDKSNLVASWSTGNVVMANTQSTETNEVRLSFVAEPWIGKDESKKEEMSTTKIRVTHRGALEHTKSYKTSNRGSAKELNLFCILGGKQSTSLYFNENLSKGGDSNLFSVEQMLMERNNLSVSLELLDIVGRSTISCFDLQNVTLLNIGKSNFVSQRKYHKGKYFKNTKGFWVDPSDNWNINIEKKNEESTLSQVAQQTGWNVVHNVSNIAEGFLSFVEDTVENWDEDQINLIPNLFGNVVKSINDSRSFANYNAHTSSSNNIKSNNIQQQHPDFYTIKPTYKICVSLTLPTSSNALIFYSHQRMFGVSNTNTSVSLIGSSPQLACQEFVTKHKGLLKAYCDKLQISESSLMVNGTLPKDLKEKLIEFMEFSQYKNVEVPSENNNTFENAESLWEFNWSGDWENMKHNTNTDSVLSLVGIKLSGDPLPVVISLPISKKPNTDSSTYMNSVELSKLKQEDNSIFESLFGNDLRNIKDDAKIPIQELNGYLYVINTQDVSASMIKKLVKPELKRCWEGQQEQQTFTKFNSSKINDYLNTSIVVQRMCQHINQSTKVLYSDYSKCLNIH